MAGALLAKHECSYMLHFKSCQPVRQMLLPAVKIASLLVWKLLLSCFFSSPSAKNAKNDLRHRRHNRGQNPGAVFVPPLQAASILSLPSGFAFGTLLYSFHPWYAQPSGIVQPFQPRISVFGNASRPLHDLYPCAFAVA